MTASRARHVLNIAASQKLCQHLPGRHGLHGHDRCGVRGVQRLLTSQNDWRADGGSRAWRQRQAPCSVVGAYSPEAQDPDLPPCFSSSFTSVMTMPRSTALHMS